MISKQPSVRGHDTEGLLSAHDGIDVDRQPSPALNALSAAALVELCAGNFEDPRINGALVFSGLAGSAHVLSAGMRMYHGDHRRMSPKCGNVSAGHGDGQRIAFAEES
jgi:hypothetical protein